MIKTTKLIQAYDAATCDVCFDKSLHKNKHVNYHCPECQYDLCFNCASIVQEKRYFTYTWCLLTEGMFYLLLKYLLIIINH